MIVDLRRLLAAPELLVIDLVDSALDTLIRSLLVEHPPLAQRAPAFAESPLSRRARDVLRASRRLQHTLIAYQQAVDDVLDDRRDLPF